MPAVRFKEPNMNCFVANKFANIRQTQNAIPSNMKVTLTVFSFIFLVFYEVTKHSRRKPPKATAPAKVRQSRETTKKSRKKLKQAFPLTSQFLTPSYMPTGRRSLHRCFYPLVSQVINNHTEHNQKKAHTDSHHPIR